MLVLSRKIGQQIRIGDQITLTIVKTQGQTVRVGIEAPREVRVIRAELPPRLTNDDSAENLSDPLSSRSRSTNAKPQPRRIKRQRSPNGQDVTSMPAPHSTGTSAALDCRHDA